MILHILLCLEKKNIAFHEWFSNDVETSSVSFLVARMLLTVRLQAPILILHKIKCMTLRSGTQNDIQRINNVSKHCVRDQHMSNVSGKFN